MAVKIKRRQYSDSPSSPQQGKDELGLQNFNNKQNADDFKNAADSALNEMNNSGNGSN